MIATLAPLPPGRGERLGEGGTPFRNRLVDARAPLTPTLSSVKGGGEGGT